MGEAAPFEDWARLKGEQLHRAYLEACTAWQRPGSSGEYRARPDVRPPAGRDRGVGRERPAAADAPAGAQRAARRGAGAVRGLPQGAEKRAEGSAIGGDNPAGTSRSGRGVGSEPPSAHSQSARLPASWRRLKRRKGRFLSPESRSWAAQPASGRRAETARGSMAFITGGAGRGKTALLREFARQASMHIPTCWLRRATATPTPG